MFAYPRPRAAVILVFALAGSACNFLPDRGSSDGRHVERRRMSEEELVAANAERTPAPAPVSVPEARPAEANVAQASLDAPAPDAKPEEEALADVLDSLADENEDAETTGI